MPQPDSHRVQVSVPTFETDTHLGSLHHWLTLEVPTGWLFFISFFGPLSFLVSILKIGAILFTPFMLWKLVLLKRWGWIAGFVVVVVGPYLAAGFVDGWLGGLLEVYIPLGLFYGYTYALKFATSEWLELQRGEAMFRNADAH